MFHKHIFIETIIEVLSKLKMVVNGKKWHIGTSAFPSSSLLRMIQPTSNCGEI